MNRKFSSFFNFSIAGLAPAAHYKNFLKFFKFQHVHWFYLFKFAIFISCETTTYIDQTHVMAELFAHHNQLFRLKESRHVSEKIKNSKPLLELLE